MGWLAMIAVGLSLVAAAGCRPRARWDWNGLVGTGQSLAIGYASGAVESTTQPYDNLKYDVGTGTMVPLVAPIRTLQVSPVAYPDNIAGETPHEQLCNSLTAGDRSYLAIPTVVGQGGAAMSVIKKGGSGNAYASTLTELAAIKALAIAAGKTFGVAAVILTHGESDYANSNYAADVVQMQADYEADIKALTGQTAPIPLLLVQQHSFPFPDEGNVSAVQQWTAPTLAPGKVFLIGPKYQYEHADSTHMVTNGYRQLGDLYAKVMRKILANEAWHPLQPVSSNAVTRGTKSITVTFDVPFPPLAWDSNIAPPYQTGSTEWATGKGFEVENNAGKVTITSATISGSTVVLALATEPSNAGLVVRYALKLADDAVGPPLRNTWRRGLLKDSDPTLDSRGNAIPNFAVAFELPVPAL